MKAPIRRLLIAGLRVIFPPQCLGCDTVVQDDGALCPTCWPDTPFITGMVCDACGVALPGGGADAAICDDCQLTPRPWLRGRAALDYGGKARGLVLALKHADRLDLAGPLAGWMARAGAPILTPGMIAVPVPLSAQRMLARRANQAAVLALALARQPQAQAVGLRVIPDALLRTRHTGSQDGLTRDQRLLNLRGAFAVRPARRAALSGQPVLLIDDVMTSGATLAGCAQACLEAGSGPVSVLVLARVAKGG
ncbi:double zinc ribbon domain-containing protein [Paracoccus sp. p4-l81]|uniref:double zinc ribbon domain-containing protein n=1 Tax=Paracoccus sp. p4-l81 TaxID=3342806 RepID=UPI0035BA505F